LNVFPIRVSALRERPEDIPVLTWHFVNEFSRRMNKSIGTIPSENDVRAGTVSLARKCAGIANVIERAVIVSIGPVLKVSVEELSLRVESEEEMRFLVFIQGQPSILATEICGRRLSQGRGTARNRGRSRETTGR
jgi:DNA-binding NtrC family response regulator